jgi:hypothetical protein
MQPDFCHNPAGNELTHHMPDPFLQRASSIGLHCIKLMPYKYASGAAVKHLNRRQNDVIPGNGAPRLK